MIYGYARCTTNESKQDINRQIKELKAAGADEVIFEYEHGDARTKKELNLLLELAQAGDTIITLEVSRLSRSTQQLCELIDIIREKRLRLVIMGSITIDEDLMDAANMIAGEKVHIVDNNNGERFET